MRRPDLLQRPFRRGVGLSSNLENTRLTRLGINTNVLQVEWPKNIGPSQSTNFESLARNYRYRILGNACREFNLRNLLLAHHGDDQYETVMMRLISGHGPLGLLGMKPNNRIPECYGIYSVYD